MPAVSSIISAMYGVASASTKVTILSYAFVGSSLTLVGAGMNALANATSVDEFMEQGNWGTVISTTGGGAFGAFGGYLSWNEQQRGLGHSWTTERRNYWKSEANNSNSPFYGNSNALQGKSPKGYVLHHPYGRYGSKIGMYYPITTQEHRSIHAMYGYGNGKGGFYQYYSFYDWWWIFRR